MSTPTQYCLDANVFIDAWQSTYPRDVISGLWPQLAVAKNNFILIKPIFDEIDPYSSNDKKQLSAQQLQEKYPLRSWLEDVGIGPQPILSDIEGIALQLEQKYQTKYIGKGANKNDILLIAYTKKNNHYLVTLEAEQKEPPKSVSRYKIPLICKEEGVECLKFIELLRKLEIKI